MQQKTIQIMSVIFFVCLVLWGIYSLLYYLGVPVHGSVLLTGEDVARLNEYCSSDEYFCRGLFSLFPFITYSFLRMSPLLSYGVISLLIYVGFLIFQFTKTGKFYISFYFKPWHVFALFIVSLTLIFSSIAFGFIETNTTSGVRMLPVRQIIEPNAQLYRSIEPEALKQLQNNFFRLKNAGCLIENGEFVAGVPQYLMSPFCIYSSFAGRVLSQVLFITLLVFELLVAGRMFLVFVSRLLKILSNRFSPEHTDNWSLHIESKTIEAMLSVSFGAFLFVAILWTLAISKILIVSVGWAFVILVPIVGYKHLLYWIRTFLFSSTHVQRPFSHVSIFLLWLLISYVALNFLNVVRPFPIGWDDLGSYLNRPRLMVSYGAFIYSMAPFQWEYITSLGFLLFGYGSTFGATASMLINWMAGIMAIGSVYVFTRFFLGKGSGILAALLYYMLPLIGHFSFADMKIDNAVFAMGSMSMFTLFHFLFPKIEEDELWHPHWAWLVLSGLFGGIAFGMKQTAVMVLMANAAVLLGFLLHGAAFVAVVFAAMMVFISKGVLNMDKFLTRVSISPDGIFADSIMMFFVFAALLSVIFALYYAKKRLPMTLKSVFILAIATIIPILPWVIHNNFMRGWENPGIEFGAPNTLTPTFDLMGLRRDETNSSREKIVSLPEDLVVDQNNPNCSATGYIEELDRYWGFDKGWSHYITLPWRSVNNLNSAGYYVSTMPGLLLFPILLLLPFFWMKKANWLRWMFVGTLFILVEWMLLANGVPWYGIGVFLGLVVGLEALAAKAPDFPSKIVYWTFIAFWILIMLNNRFWQFEMQRNIFEYSMGKVDAYTMQERTIPHYDDIADKVLERHESMPTRPYLYRVGTFIPYFIPKNLEVIGLVDHQLDMFNCLYAERDAGLTLKRLKAMGFNSIIFDTNTATIERDTNGSLHQKVSTFIDFLLNPETGIQVVIDDPGAGVAFFLIP